MIGVAFLYSYKAIGFLSQFKDTWQIQELPGKTVSVDHPSPE